MTSIASPTLWFITIGVVVALLAVDFIATRRPHEVSMKEAIAWSAFYVALPLAFGLYVWNVHGGDRGLEYYTGYLVEKTLSVDNLFVFMLLLAAFAVPEVLKQRVLLYGIIGAPHGKADGFGYSAALKGKAEPWAYENMNAWLLKPNTYAPGTRMAFAGIGNTQQRADVIAYLKSISPKAPEP